MLVSSIRVGAVWVLLTILTLITMPWIWQTFNKYLPKEEKMEGRETGREGGRNEGTIGLVILWLILETLSLPKSHFPPPSLSSIVPEIGSEAHDPGSISKCYVEKRRNFTLSRFNFLLGICKAHLSFTSNCGVTLLCHVCRKKEKLQGGERRKRE